METVYNVCIPGRIVAALYILPPLLCIIFTHLRFTYQCTVVLFVGIFGKNDQSTNLVYSCIIKSIVFLALKIAVDFCIKQ